MSVKYPNITVRLVGQNGNVFNLIGIVSAALKRNHVPQAERDMFKEKAMNAESYDDVLSLIRETVNVK